MANLAAAPSAVARQMEDDGALLLLLDLLLGCVLRQ